MGTQKQENGGLPAVAATGISPRGGGAGTVDIGQGTDDALDRATDLIRGDWAVVVDRGPQRAGDSAFETAREIGIVDVTLTGVRQSVRPFAAMVAALAHQLGARTPVEVPATGRTRVHHEVREVVGTPFGEVRDSHPPATPALGVLPRGRGARFSRFGVHQRRAVASMDLERTPHERDSTPAGNPRLTAKPTPGP